METFRIQDVDQAHHMYHFSYQQLCSARLALDTIGTDHQSPGSSFGTVALLREPRLVPMQTAPPVVIAVMRYPQLWSTSAANCDNVVGDTTSSLEESTSPSVL